MGKATDLSHLHYRRKSTMGDPHKNTWGGKNNSWGHNRKKKSNTQYNGSMNKLGMAVIGGIFLFTLAHYGYGELIDALDKVSSTKDKVEKVQDFISNNTYAENGELVTNKLGYFIDTSIELDAETVKGILEFMEEIKSKNTVEDMDVVIMDYSTLADGDTYNSNIIQQLSNYSKPVTFVFINQAVLDENNMYDEIDRIQEIVNNNIFVTGTKFNSVKLSARLNQPAKGNITIAITFTQE